jgi:hypothetical protein
MEREALANVSKPPNPLSRQDCGVGKPQREEFISAVIASSNHFNLALSLNTV